MPIYQNKSLKEYNTFNIEVKSLYSFFVATDQEFVDFIQSPIFKSHKSIVLGGGSNILFTNDYDGIVIHMQNKGIEIVKESNETVYLKVQAGENWDDLVKNCVNRGLGGIENLAMIPGTAGASPIQNIGAYGVELKNVLSEVEFIQLDNLKRRIFKKEECELGYRESIFKKELANNAVILNITLRLNKKKHTLMLDYGSISDVLKTIKNPGIKEVRNAVIRIREEKLPNPKVLPNAGSFFKNPMIPIPKFNVLKKKFPNLISYPIDEKQVKLAAGQLIDLCGWKGKSENNVGVHDKQALVIINYGRATGKEILDFSNKIEESVFQEFGIKMEKEVTII